MYSESVGNIMVDAASARKYTHFVRLMGRSASHLTLETALQTHPQAALICEEIHATGTTLAGVTQQVRPRLWVWFRSWVSHSPARRSTPPASRSSA